MKKFILLALVSTLAACNNAAPEDFTATLSNTTITVPPNTNYGLYATICGQGAFRGNVSVTLENAPFGVSVADSPKSIAALDCSKKAAEVANNLYLNIVQNATLGTAKVNVVFASKNVTKKVEITLTVATGATAAPVIPEPVIPKPTPKP